MPGWYISVLKSSGHRKATLAFAGRLPTPRTAKTVERNWPVSDSRRCEDGLPAAADAAAIGDNEACGPSLGRPPKLPIHPIRFTDLCAEQVVQTRTNIQTDKKARLSSALLRGVMCLFAVLTVPVL